MHQLDVSQLEWNLDQITVQPIGG